VVILSPKRLERYESDNSKEIALDCWVDNHRQNLVEQNAPILDTRNGYRFKISNMAPSADEKPNTDAVEGKTAAGWSSGELKPHMFPVTRGGRLELYSSNRRWIGLNKGWSRVGADEGDGKGETNQYSHRTTKSSKMQSLLGDGGEDQTPEERLKMLSNEALSVRCLLAQLCEQLYRNGWATGTAGGVSIRVGGPTENRPWRVFVAPSGIQKEDMVGDDVFEMDMDYNVIHGPKSLGMKLSACTPLWFLVYKHRPSATSVIHTHSVYSQLATLLDPTEKAKTLKITHLEMIKGVGGHAYDDVLEIPILDNRPSEDMLSPQFEEALKKYPRCNCVLVRRHGLFVWGDSWEQAKTQTECFDYLFETAVRMKQIGIDCSKIPSHGSFRTDFDEYHGGGSKDGGNKREAAKAIEDEEPPEKRAKTSGDNDKSPTGWNASGDVDNKDDLLSNEIPLLPRDYKCLLLDIEGCTTAISFVKDVLFPYVIEHAAGYIAKNLSVDEQRSLTDALKADLTPEQVAEVGESSNPTSIVTYMVQKDLKVASLKSLQGKMWKDGYLNGTLKGHVYEDFVPMLEWMKKQNVKIYIYSSGSVQAQKLLFGNSIEGDLTKHFAGHFDITNSGSKKKSLSYARIAEKVGMSPSEIVFCSDAVAELEAASEAGIGKCVMTVRPGNAPLSKEDSEKHSRVFSLMQLCGSGK